MLLFLGKYARLCDHLMHIVIFGDDTLLRHDRFLWRINSHLLQRVEPPFLRPDIHSGIEPDRVTSIKVETEGTQLRLAHPAKTDSNLVRCAILNVRHSGRRHIIGKHLWFERRLVSRRGFVFRPTMRNDTLPIEGAEPDKRELAVQVNTTSLGTGLSRFQNVRATIQQLKPVAA